METLLIIGAVTMVGLSAICSGLNVALLSMSPSDLQRKAKLGNKHATAVLPLRTKIHLSLAAILLSNVAVISAISILLSSIMNGFLAGLISTMVIVVFGEVIPQALSNKHALRVSSFFAPLLKLMIVVTYPLAKPLQLLLDAILGHQQGSLESRHELGLMISEHLGNSHSELDEDEVEIVRNALQLSEKKVREIMTPIKQTYWLKPKELIDGRMIDEIKFKSHSRIPVFDAKLSKCYGVLHMKDLVDIDFDESPVELDKLPLHPTKLVGSKTALDTMFRKFIAAKSHLIPIERDHKIVGIVTIEDLIEEILGHEIADEHDHALQRS